MISLVGMVLAEQHDELHVAARRWFGAESLAKLEQEEEKTKQRALFAEV